MNTLINPSDCHPDKPRFSKGMCVACWTRMRRQTDPLFKERANAARRKWKLNNREKNAAAVLRHYYKHHEANKRKRREYCRKNPSKIRNSHLKFYYGISVADYDCLFVKQHGLCALCDLEEKNGKMLAVDHCHNSGQIRALLCGSCNGGLGLFDDDESLLEKAIAYLRKHKTEGVKV